MRKNQMTGSVVWRFLCWLTFAGAAYLYAIGSIPLAIALGLITALLVVIDIKATRIEAKMRTELGDNSPFDVLKRDKVFQIVLALSILVGVQIVMKLVYERSPDMEPPAFCLVCHR